MPHYPILGAPALQTGVSSLTGEGSSFEKTWRKLFKNSELGQYGLSPRKGIKESSVYSRASPLHQPIFILKEGRGRQTNQGWCELRRVEAATWNRRFISTNEHRIELALLTPMLVI
jgi:hypothetical protein